MTDKSNNEKNLPKSKDYYSFIKEAYIHYINYLNDYKNTISEFSNKLNELREKGSFKFNKNTDESKYKNINPNFIIDITSYMTKLLSSFSNNLTSFMGQIDSCIELLNTIFKDNIMCIGKSGREFYEFKNKLLKNCDTFEKLGEVLNHSMQNTENTMLKYYNMKNNPAQIDEKVVNSLENARKEIHSSIVISKQLEEQYILCHISIENDRISYSNLVDKATNGEKKIAKDLTNKLNERIVDIVQIFKKYYKNNLNDIENVLNEVNNFKSNPNLGKIIEDSIDLNFNFESKDMKKYIPICTTDSEDNHYKIIIEDGLGKLGFFTDSGVIEAIKELSKEFKLVDLGKINFDMEEQKMKIFQMTKKVLSFHENKNIFLSDKEIEDFKSLLDKHQNRVIFLQRLSSFRVEGCLNFPDNIYELLSSFFKIIIDKILRDKDFHCFKNINIMSQTYYKLNQEEKIYLYSSLKEEKVFTNYDFWKEYTDYSINREKNLQEKRDGIVVGKKDMIKIIFGQVLSIVHNMVQVECDINKIKELIKPYIKKFHLGNDFVGNVDLILQGSNSTNYTPLAEDLKKEEEKFNVIDNEKNIPNTNNLDDKNKINLDTNKIKKDTTHTNDILKKNNIINNINNKEIKTNLDNNKNKKDIINIHEDVKKNQILNNENKRVDKKNIDNKIINIGSNKIKNIAFEIEKRIKENNESLNNNSKDLVKYISNKNVINKNNK